MITKSKTKASADALRSSARALTALPIEVVERIANNLVSKDKAKLALCCKAMLPFVCMGHVSVNLGETDGGKPLTQLNSCLAKQPDGVSHLELFSCGYMPSTRRLIDLSLLSNLRKLSLYKVSFHLPALQPIATRLQSLDITHSYLEGSADGFLGGAWTALTALSLDQSIMKDDVLTALNLPALEVLRITKLFKDYRGGWLQPDTLCCPQLCSLALEHWASEGSSQCCNLLSIARLTTLIIIHSSPLAAPDLVLPASVTRLTMQNRNAQKMTLSGALLEAAKCIRGGVQLRSLTCAHSLPSPHPEGMPWGASSVAHYRELGEQLSGLTDLSVHGNWPALFNAIGAVACTAPSLTHLKIFTQGPNGMELPPICSASLESITVLYNQRDLGFVRPQPVILTILPGCIQLRDVHVQFDDRPFQGASVKIRCHCDSQRCIVPFKRRTEFIEESPWELLKCKEELGIRFVPMPASPQGVQPYRVLFTWHVAGPEQAPKWGHVVIPGVL